MDTRWTHIEFDALFMQIDKTLDTTDLPFDAALRLAQDVVLPKHRRKPVTSTSTLLSIKGRYLDWLHYERPESDEPTPMPAAPRQDELDKFVALLNAQFAMHLQPGNAESVLSQLNHFAHVMPKTFAKPMPQQVSMLDQPPAAKPKRRVLVVGLLPGPGGEVAKDFPDFDLTFLKADKSERIDRNKLKAHVRGCERCIMMPWIDRSTSDFILSLMPKGHSIRANRGTTSLRNILVSM